MKSLQLGLIVAVALVALLGSALWVMAQSAPPDPEPTQAAEDVAADGAPAESAPTDEEATVEASAIQAVGLLITPTVGTVAGTCSITNTVQVRANTTLYYCFRVHHTGVDGDEPLIIRTIRTSLGLNEELQSPIIVNPGNPIVISDTNSSDDLDLSDIAIEDATSLITLTASPADSDPQVIATSRVNVDVVNPSLSVVASVGQDRNNCPSSQSIRIPAGQAIIFCVKVTNLGDITLTNHSLVANAPLNINASFVYTLAPEATLNILPNNMASLGINNGTLERANITGASSNTFNYTALTRSNLSVTGASTATVDIGNTTVRLTKTVSTIPEDCSQKNTIQVQPGTRVYYCVVIQNTGIVTLTHHQLTESYLSIDVKFDYPLLPGASLTVTNKFLAGSNLPVVFGPFEIDPQFGPTNVVGNTMSYNGTSEDGFPASATAGTSVTYPPTPTRTNTPGPRDPTSTPTPQFTNTPTITPIPPSPTPSLTPTLTPITPSPTPTRSYAILQLETPTPRSQIAGIPGAPSQNPQQDPAQLPTPDPNQLGQLPVQDPVLATATQMAVDATATAIVAEATASQLLIESAAATALAESQAILPTAPPDSPLATPTIDPLLTQDGNLAGMPVAPGLEIPSATPIAPPTEALPLGTPLPGADVTVLPPLITAVVGTKTPAVVVLVVTNTPEVQRPIVYPTPTATPDFVMAAARTFDIAVTTVGWLWFLVGSLIFFVTTGIVAGLFFRQSETNRYELPEPEYWLEEEPPAERPRPPAHTGPSVDDEWPAELP